jgi:hypothetical protein
LLRLPLTKTRTRHTAISQKKRTLVAFPATISILSTDVVPHGKRKAKDKSNGTRREYKHVGRQAPFIAGEVLENEDATTLKKKSGHVVFRW